MERVAKVHCAAIVSLVRCIVANWLTNYTCFQVVRNTLRAEARLAEEDQPAFVALVEAQLDGLTAELLPAYGINKSDFDYWSPRWKPNLGIVDVLANPSG